MRFGKLLVVAIVFVTSWTAPGPATGQEAERTGAMRLASQTSWVAPGQELQLRLSISTTAKPEDVEVAVAVYRRVGSRSEFARTLEARPRGAPLTVSATSLATLGTDPGGAVLIRLPVQDPAQAAEASRLRLGFEGVYPVRVELREIGGGETLAELVTHLVYAKPPSEGGFRLGTALVLPVHAPVALGPDLERRLSSRRADGLVNLARAVEAHKDVPLTVWPTPETVAALDSSIRPEDREAVAALSSGITGRQVAVSSYVPLSLPAMADAGLSDEAAAQLERGALVTEQLLGRRPASRTWIESGELNEPAIDLLRALQADQLVIPGEALTPTRLPITLAQPFELDVRAVRRPVALAADAGLATHFVASGDTVLAAHRLLADLAVIYYDSPGRRRVVVAQPPRGWRPTAAFLDTVLEGVATSPVLSPITVDEAFETVPAAASEGGKPLLRKLAAVESDGQLPSDQLRATRRRLESFTSMLETDNPIDDTMEELLLTSEAAGLRSVQRGAYLNAVDNLIAGQLRLIKVPERRSITLTARTGEIPVTVLSEAGYPVRLIMRVASDKLEFPDGHTRRIELARPNFTERFSVRARASGSFPLRISLSSPDGGLQLDRSRFVVRSAAVSGVGVVLSVGAGVFLLVWWGRHLVRGRRNRRLVPT